MHTLTITVQRRTGVAWPVVAEVSAPGDFLPTRSESVLRFADIPVDPDARSYPRRVREHLTGLSADARAYGEALGGALFRDTLRAAFAKALGAGGGALRVLLFVEDPDLQALRWERVCGPVDDGWVFLALDQRLPFSMYLPAVTDRRFHPIGRRDLRALVVVAAPSDVGTKYRMPPFDAAAAVAGVRSALGDVPCTVLASAPGADGPPTLDAICERITAEAYSLLHVVCHGRYLRVEHQTVLYLTDPDGTTAPVTDAQLIERLGGLAGTHGLPHFTFLCACESASPEAADGAGGLAHRLVRELGMPAVLAMTEPVTIGTGLALAEKFYIQLRAHGHPDLALAESWAGLAGRPDVHVPALFGRLGGRPLFADDLADGRPLTPSEIDHALTRMAALLKDRAPVVEGEFLRHEAVIRRFLETPAGSLPEQDRTDLEAARRVIEEVCARVLEISFAGLALGHTAPAYDARCPFRGLYPFRPEYTEFYFGREALVEHLHGKLVEHNFLAVLGPSGSGKSSVVLAGLLPALVRERPRLKFLYLTPGSEPDTFLEAVLAHGPSSDLLLVDQFEELFTMCTDPARRRAFVEQLLSAVPRMMVVITMRADFWGECAAFPALKELMQSRQELVGPMTTAELRAATDRQARSVGLRFEADLSQTLVDEVAGEPGAMPLLQHALQEVWKRRHGRWLVASEYRAVGGVRRAIAETAEGFYRDLSDADRERVRDIFVRLTRLGDDSLDGVDRRDTRRRVKLSELVPANDDPAETKRLVKRLADEGARLLVSGVQRGEETVEVAHEALIRYWPRLRGWLDEDQAALRLLAEVQDAAARWQRSGTADRLIHRRARLTEALGLKMHPRIKPDGLVEKYLAACTQAARVEWRRRSLFGLGAGVLTTLLVWFAADYIGDQRVSESVAGLNKAVPDDPAEAARAGRTFLNRLRWLERIPLSSAKNHRGVIDDQLVRAAAIQSMTPVGKTDSPADDLLVFTSGGESFLLAHARDKTVVAWRNLDSESGRWDADRVFRLPGVELMADSPGAGAAARVCLFGRSDGSVVRLEHEGPGKLRTRTVLAAWTGDPGAGVAVTALRARPDGRLAAVGDNSGRVRVFDPTIAATPEGGPDPSGKLVDGRQNRGPQRIDHIYIGDVKVAGKELGTFVVAHDQRDGAAVWVNSGFTGDPYYEFDSFVKNRFVSVLLRGMGLKSDDLSRLQIRNWNVLRDRLSRSGVSADHTAVALGTTVPTILAVRSEEVLTALGKRHLEGVAPIFVLGDHLLSSRADGGSVGGVARLAIWHGRVKAGENVSTHVFGALANGGGLAATLPPGLPAAGELKADSTPQNRLYRYNLRNPFAGDGKGELPPIILIGFNPARGEHRVIANARTYHSAVFTPDGEKLILGANDGSVEVYSTRWDDQPPMRLLATGSPVESVRTDPGGRWLFTGQADGQIRCWDLNTAKSYDDIARRIGDAKGNSAQLRSAFNDLCPTR